MLRFQHSNYLLFGRRCTNSSILTLKLPVRIRHDNLQATSYIRRMSVYKLKTFQHSQINYTGNVNHAIKIGSGKRKCFCSSSSKPNRASESNTAKSDTTSSADSSTTESIENMTMLQRFLAPKPMPKRYTFAWYREMVLICTVFAITGSSTMLVRT